MSWSVCLFVLELWELPAHRGPWRGGRGAVPQAELTAPSGPAIPLTMTCSVLLEAGTHSDAVWLSWGRQEAVTWLPTAAWALALPLPALRSRCHRAHMPLFLPSPFCHPSRVHPSQQLRFPLSIL